jgi:hypothetical protein
MDYKGYTTFNTEKKDGVSSGLYSKIRLIRL